MDKLSSTNSQYCMESVVIDERLKGSQHGLVAETELNLGLHQTMSLSVQCLYNAR